MGIETAVASKVGGAVIGAGANLIGNKMTNTANKNAASEANRVADARTAAALGYLEPAYDKALGYLEPAYGQGMDAQQRAYEQSLALQGQTFRPTIDAMQGGNLAAQRAILAGLPMQRAAILGGKIDYSQLQPYQQNIDTSAIEGLFNPQAMQFRSQAPMQAPMQAPQEQMSPEMISYLNSMQNGGYS
jgi:hypothetical protein